MEYLGPIIFQILNPKLIVDLLFMMFMYFFNGPISTKHFNYWTSVCLGITVLLRDILFGPHLAYYPIQLASLTLSVALIMLLTYFYARKDWKTYTKRNLWLLFIIDMLLAALYNLDIILEPENEYTAYMLTEIWIRPTITYGLVACFIKGRKAASETNHQ